MSTLLFYDNPAPLNSKTHLNLRIKPSEDGLRFSAKTNSVLLAAVEFPQACRHLPIVFAKTADKQVLPVALSLEVLAGMMIAFLAGAIWIFSTREYVMEQ